MRPVEGPKNPGRPGLKGEAGPGLLARYGSWEVVVALLAVGLYIRTVGFGWVYDDQMEIVLNPFVRSLKNLPLIFSTTVWTGSGMETYLYRPLALASYALNHMISGLDPWSYHLVNVLLYAAIAGMVVRVGRLWGLPALAAGLAGLFFVVHPIHVEVVAAVFGRKDLLATGFVLAMILLHPRAVSRGGWWASLPILAFAAAMLSKEVGAVGLILVAVQDWFLTRDRAAFFGHPRRPRIYVGYVAALLAYILIRNQVTGGVGVPDTFYMDNPLVQAPLPIRVATAVAVMGKGLALQALPLGMSPDYSFDAIPLVRSLFDPRLMISMGALVLLGWGLARENRNRALLAAATLWYAFSLLPTANLLVLVGTIFGERLLFLPSVAFCLVAGYFAALLLERARWAVIPVILWSALLTTQTIRYTGSWSDDISLFRAAVASVPKSTKANHKLGEELLRAGRIGEALPYLREALRIAPDNEFAALTLTQAKQQVAQRYLPSAPADPREIGLPDDPEILYTLGNLSRERGDMDGAMNYWTRALASDPDHSPTLADLGLLALRRGDTVQAEERLGQAVEGDPGLARAWYNLGRIHMARGQVPSARRALRAFVEAAGGRFPRQVAWAREVLDTLPDR